MMELFPTPGSCYRCDCKGGGIYRPHEGETDWYIGLDAYGQAHYACEGCAPGLFDAQRIADKGKG